MKQMSGIDEKTNIPLKNLMTSIKGIIIKNSDGKSCYADQNSSVLESFDFVLSTALAARNDRSCVPHLFTRRSCQPGDETDNRLCILSLDENL